MIFEAVKPETLITLSGIAAILVFLILGNFRNWYVTGPTHKRELAAMQDRVDQAVKDRDQSIKTAREECAQRVQHLRDDHATQLAALSKVAEGLRTDFAAILASKDRDIDQWRGAWQITDQAGREEWGAQVDELVAGFRTIKRWIGAFQSQTGVPELSERDDGF